jgi:glycosyltransferase involved in cell wall biosynthesis
MKTSGLNILLATPHFPYPLIGGERIKLNYLIKHLAKNNKVFLVSLDRGYEVKDEYINEIKSLNVDTNVFKINNLKSTFYAGFFSLFRHPLEIEYFNNSGFNKKIKEIIENNHIDLILNFFIRTAEHVKNLPVKKILIAEDCRSYYQSRTSDASSNLKQKLIRQYDSKKIAKYESEIMNYFDITTVVTQEDYFQMKILNPKAEIKIISQGVSTEIFRPSQQKIDRKDILFLGKLDVWANILMVQKIVNEIFPLIKKSIPDAKLNIVGSNPVKEIINYANESIIIHQNPKDIAEYYQKSAIFLHPHIGGSGIQNKVLEAMSVGCPVVTSPSGANGIDIINFKNGFIAQNVKEFADFSIQLLKDSELNNKIGHNSREYIKLEKSWDSVFIQWDKMISEL